MGLFIFKFTVVIFSFMVFPMLGFIWSQITGDPVIVMGLTSIFCLLMFFLLMWREAIEKKKEFTIFFTISLGIVISLTSMGGVNGPLLLFCWATAVMIAGTFGDNLNVIKKTNLDKHTLYNATLLGLSDYSPYSLKKLMNLKDQLNSLLSKEKINFKEIFLIYDKDASLMFAGILQGECVRECYPQCLDTYYLNRANTYSYKISPSLEITENTLDNLIKQGISTGTQLQKVSLLFPKKGVVKFISIYSKIYLSVILDFANRCNTLDITSAPEVVDLITYSNNLGINLSPELYYNLTKHYNLNKLSNFGIDYSRYEYFCYDDYMDYCDETDYEDVIDNILECDLQEIIHQSKYKIGDTCYYFNSTGEEIAEKIIFISLVESQLIYYLVNEDNNYRTVLQCDINYYMENRNA